MNRRIPLFLVILLAISLAAASPALPASGDVRLSKGQTLYVPVYSNVFSGPKRLSFPLATTLSIRNTDPSSSLRVTDIEYYDTNGKLLGRYLAKPQVVGPFASSYVHLEEKEVAGGFGANFVVRWSADRTVNAPIVECVMIGTTSGQGISFVSQGQEIREETR